METCAYYELCLFIFLILTFSALRVGLRFLKKNINFRYVSSGVYSMIKYGKSGIIAACSYKNDNFVITRGGQNVTSESTPSGLLPS